MGIRLQFGLQGRILTFASRTYKHLHIPVAKAKNIKKEGKKPMKTTATTLRKLVKENSLTLKRLSKEQLSDPADFAELTNAYENCLDAMTEWAAADYKHKTTKEIEDKAYNTCKTVLGFYTTKDDRIAVDPMSIRTIRDQAIHPKRFYSSDYTAASKALRDATKILQGTINCLDELGYKEPGENDDLQKWNASLDGEIYLNGINVPNAYIQARANVEGCRAKVERVKEAGNWTWRRPVSQGLAVFADLLENYVADCLIDGYNIKPNSQIRFEKKLANEAKAAAKKANA